MDYRAAMICSLIAEVNRDRKRKHKPFTPEDFMPQIKKVMPNKQVSQVLKSINMILGGEEK